MQRLWQVSSRIDLWASTYEQPLQHTSHASPLTGFS
jgi:hypothetical protein